MSSLCVVVSCNTAARFLFLIRCQSAPSSEEGRGQRVEEGRHHVHSEPVVRGAGEPGYNVDKNRYLDIRHLDRYNI